MGFYETRCNLCNESTYHNADSEEEANEAHNKRTSHVDAKKQFDAISEEFDRKRAADLEAFEHGKEHNS